MMLYNYYISILKEKLHLKSISFKKTMIKINRNEYESINDDIDLLVESIVYERDMIGNDLNQNLNDLEWLNDCLCRFNEPMQPTKTSAIKALKKIHINIYDLYTKQRTTLRQLRIDLKKPERCYPLRHAKKFVSLKCFLKHASVSHRNIKPKNK